MSLDFNLVLPLAAEPVVVVWENGVPVPAQDWHSSNQDKILDVYAVRVDLFYLGEWSITNNLIPMARASGLFAPLWLAKEIAAKAGDLVPYLEEGVARLEAHPTLYRGFNPPNGWGSYDSFLLVVKEMLAICQYWPQAEIQTHQ